MTTMGPRPYENINSSRFPANSRKSKFSNNNHSDFPSKPRTNYYFTKNCTINTIFQHEFEKPAYNKFHSQAEEYLDSRKYNYTTENDFNCSHSYNSCKYDRKGSFKSNSSSSFEKNARNSQLSTASESESNASSGSNSSSELSGFKIVQEGKIVHNEAEEELDSPKLGMSMEETGYCWNFASSVMVTGPNAREISIPSFM